MNWAHVHLVLNHLPILGIFFGVLLLIVAIMRKSEELKKVSLGFFVLVAIAAIPVYLTGGQAEESVKDLPGVFESFIERHEEAAQLTLIAVELVGILSLAGLFVSRHAVSVPNGWVVLVFILALASGGMATWTANLGGQIRHSEIRTAGAATPTSTDAQEEREEHEEDEREDD